MTGAAGVSEKHQAQGSKAVGTQGVPGHHGLHLGLAAASHVALLSPALLVLEIPPGLWRGELVHVTHLIVGLVTHGEEELVAEANLLLKQRWRRQRVRGGEEAAPTPRPRRPSRAPHLLGVGKEQDLRDG